MPSVWKPNTTSAATALFLLLPVWLASPPVLAADAPVSQPKLPAAAKPAPTQITAMASPAAVQPASVDPLEQLRARLAERLAAAKGAPGGSVSPASGDLRLVTRPPTGAAAQPTSGGAAARLPAAKTQRERSADMQGGGAAGGHWGYAGAGGPASWGGACNTGQRQSPIDIKGGLPVDLDPVQFAYQGSRFGVVDNGHTVQVNMAAGNHIILGGRRFDLQQFHFHRPSEERIDGRQFEMSVHLVHKDEQGRLAVVTVLLDKGPSQVQPVVQKVWNNLPLERGEEAVARAPLDLNELLPADRKYYTYMGSLTTPPCSEGVQWVVLRQPVTVTAEQIELFARIYPMNSRPLQSAAGRRILQSN
jgi:carbonic anhydrase